MTKVDYQKKKRFEVKRCLCQIDGPTAIRKAVDEYNTLGAETFLKKHGFGPARWFDLVVMTSDTRRRLPSREKPT